MSKKRTPRLMVGLAALAVIAVLATGCPRKVPALAQAVPAPEVALAASGVDVTVADAAVIEDADAKALATPGQYSGHAPGLIVTVKSVKIPKDRRPIVRFTATDERGDPVARTN